MLVLGFELGKSVRILCPDGPEIWLHALPGDRPGKPRLGLAAPPDYVIDRAERLARPPAEGVPPCGSP